MKRCPECGREYDTSMMFCLDDGVELLYGPGTEPATVILKDPSSIPEHATRAQVRTTDNTAVMPSDAAKSVARGFDKRLLFIPLIVAVIVLVGFVGFRYFKPGAPSPISSVAVLPFENASLNEDIEYLSDGITESLINSLTELRQLRVIARSTAFRYKKKEVDPVTIGRELNVGALLTGSVRQIGDRLSIQADLVDASTGAQLWGKSYERQSKDVLSIKQAIANEITKELGLRLSGEEQTQLGNRDTVNPDAYQFYLRGRYHWAKRSGEGMMKAIDQFQQAVDRDPNFALAYTGLSDSYALLPSYTSVPPREGYARAEVYALRAIEIDESLAEAHSSLAFVYDRQWRWEESEKEFKRAIELNPNYAPAHQWYAMLLRKLARPSESSQEIRRALELDPLSLVINVNVAWEHLVKGDANSAIEQCKKVMELDPNFRGAYSIIGLSYIKQGRYPEALAAFEKVSVGNPDLLGLLSYGYAISGDRDRAVATLRKLEEEFARRNAGGTDVALAYVGLGDMDQAFAWLEKDFRSGASWLPDISWSPEWVAIRSDRRYKDLLKRMRLPE